jgi:fructose-1,6-bisphosphatase I
LEPDQIHERAPVFIGSKEDVALAEEYIARFEIDQAAAAEKKPRKKASVS